MKRNQRTLTVATLELTPLTEHILSQMGPEGLDIRKRLQRFYQERVLINLCEDEDKTKILG
jgi:hypothetical protein